MADIPNRTDRLLDVIEATPPDELSRKYLEATMKTDQDFASFTTRAIIESLAHLETNQRVVYAPQLQVTELGLRRLAEVGLR